MKNKTLKLMALAAVGSTCLFSADVKPQTAIVLLRTYVSTNTIPGHIGGPDIKPTVDTNGMYEIQPVPAVAVFYPPRTEVVTNYVLGYWAGTNAVELLTASKR